MITFLAVSSIVIAVLSWILNLILLILLVKRPLTHVGTYRYFFYLFIALDLAFSLSYAIVVPYWYSESGLVLMLPVGFLANSVLVKYFFSIWHGGLIAIDLLVCLSFLYRFSIICDNRVLLMFTRRPWRSLLIFLCCSLLVEYCFILNWAFAVTDPLRRKAKERNLGERFGIDIDHAFFMGVDLEHADASIRTLTMAFTINMFLIMFLLSAVMTFSGMRIDAAIKGNVLSRRAKIIQKKSYTLLIIQSINPLITLFVPCAIDMLSVLANIDLGVFNTIFAFSVFLFPLFNPIIIILFTDEYRRIFIRRASSPVNVSTVAQRLSRNNGKSLETLYKDGIF